MGKLSFFRQNAAMITRRKEQTADKLTEMRQDLQNLNEEIKVSQSRYKTFRNYNSCIKLKVNKPCYWLK